MEWVGSEAGEGVYLSNFVRARSFVFYWICRGRKEELKMVLVFCILKMKNLGEIVIFEMRFGSLA